MNLIEMSGLSLVAAERPVLTDCSLSVRQGERIGLTGESGSGKTALAHALLGYTRRGISRSAGTVRVTGRDPFDPVAAKALRGTTVNYLSQDSSSALPAEHRIAWVLDRAARRAGTPQAHRRVLRAQALERMRLPASLERAFPHELSGGQAQRVALAAALTAGAKLLILDEPTSGLDPKLVDETVRLLRTIPADIALLVVSHDLEVVSRLTERRLSMEEGRLVESGRPGARPVVSQGSGLSGAARKASPMLGNVAANGSSPVPEGGQPLLSAQNVGGISDRPPVLRGTSLSLVAGECVAIVGGSGVGKSTLACALAGTLAPTSGTLWFEGKAQPWLTSRRTRAGKLFVAHVDQDSRAALNPRERVGPALERARSAASRGGGAPLSVAELLQVVELPDYAAARLPSELSGGERQRVNLARSLASGPRVLVCDEATSALDLRTEQKVLENLATLRAAQGLSVLLITHRRQVAAVADRTYLLAGGTLTPYVAGDPISGAIDRSTPY
ncbi:ABC transporter ATP-binding protein [Streptomyces sp. PTY087I2]|uniref:ABC transporter ATP-binding protein n=1 Tax=Streptomyces sp. PTY087I2 TaxID=1819298 RepID=UPI000827FA0B|nr:ATP-binding cassette domain-containing protein [Streptomyces sp. PTY087I2]OCC14046.1 Glutathione import ATP-binding protein GsiA [Streptomyces sp. PTY087I2]